MKKNTTPSAKAAQKQKETVRALSMNEVEEALTKSTYGGKKLEPLDEDDIIITGIEEENRKLRETIRELRAINEEWAGGKKEDLLVLKNECITLKEENKKYLREIDDYKKTISKMKYAHDEEVRALEDELAEAKILGKKAGEYTSMLDADSDAFETILELAKVIHGLTKSAESVSLLIKDEVEGHI